MAGFFVIGKLRRWSICSDMGLKKLNREINSDLLSLSHAKAISMIPNTEWVKAGNLQCFKIADRFIFQFSEVSFTKTGSLGNTGNLLWTMDGDGPGIGYERVFLLYPILKDENPIRIIVASNKVYGHYTDVKANVDYYGMLIM